MTLLIRRVGAPITLWVKRKGKGTYANDRPPILCLISRTSHEVRNWVLSHADYPLGEAYHTHDC